MKDALDRRGLFAAGLALSTAPSLARSAPTALDQTWLDAVGIANLVRRRKLSPLEAVDAAIARAERLQPKLNFMVTTDYDRARDRARTARIDLPLAGVPFLLKDLIDYPGLPTRRGSRSTAQDLPATQIAAHTQAYLDAGLQVLGKSSTPEFALLPTTEPLAFGPTRNPWNLDRSAGGSSGGAAAAVAAGVVPIASASDGGGSIRIPSSCCGVFGLKPSRGRMPGSGRAQTRAIELSVAHCISRSVRDSATLLALTENARPPAPLTPLGLVSRPGQRRLRIGLLTETDSGGAPDPDVLDATLATARLLESLGHDLRPTRWPFAYTSYLPAFMALWSGGTASTVKQIAAQTGRSVDETMVEPFTLSFARAFDQLPPGEFGRAVETLNGLSANFEAWMSGFDVLLSPVLAKPPPRLGWVSSQTPYETLVEHLRDYVGYTTFFNVVGAPAMSVPLHRSPDGLPIGSHFVAPINGERTLLELAFELEAAAPWRDRHPIL
ncbi:MAG: amidase [Caulobacter sp.]